MKIPKIRGAVASETTTPLELLRQTPKISSLAPALCHPIE